MPKQVARIPVLAHALFSVLLVLSASPLLPAHRMQLTLFTDYALRTLLYLGSHPDHVIPATAVSEAYGISPEHTVKAAKWLTQRGYVRAQRGKGGGLKLALDPRTIGLGALVRETEPHLDLLEC